MVVTGASDGIGAAAARPLSDVGGAVVVMVGGRSGCRPHRDLRRLFRFYDWCARIDVPEITTLAQTIKRWQPELLVFLETKITNARTEGTGWLIKQVKRAACGFRNKQNYESGDGCTAPGTTPRCQRDQAP